MNKNRIRLTESQLHRVIKESVKKVLNEGDFLDALNINKMLGKSSPHTQKMTRMFCTLNNLLTEIGNYANEQGIYDYTTPDRGHIRGRRYNDIKKIIENMREEAHILETSWGQYL